MLNGLSLFSGIGGFELALAPWVRPVAYCESDERARAVLFSRMASGHLPCAPIWSDVRTLRGSRIPTDVDIIYGGFPCQDVSVAGNREGLDGKRTGLFREVVRLTEECAPVFVFLENVWPGMSKHVETVASSFEAIGFQCRDGFMAASDVGAWHQRERWFFLAAHAERLKLRLQQRGGAWAEQEKSGRRSSRCFANSFGRR